MPWDERLVLGDKRGLPWWGAVLLAFVLAALGAVVDLKMQNALSWVFRICYFVGCVGGVCAVQRRGVFGPIVQPPLVLAVTVPVVVLLISGTPANSDTLSKALAVGTPLINGFPAMAVTTGFTLAVGIFRLYQERNPEAQRKRESSDRPNAAQRTGGARRPAEDGRPRPGEEGRRPDEQGRVRPAEDGRPRPGQSNRGGRAQRPPERSGSQRRPTGENPLPPPGRRQPADEGPRRGDPGTRLGKIPPAPGTRRPRGAPPDDADRRRSGGQPPGADPRPRRMPPRSGDPRGGPGGADPRRAPGRGTPPPRRRPWDDA